MAVVCMKIKPVWWVPVRRDNMVANGQDVGGKLRGNRAGEGDHRERERENRGKRSRVCRAAEVKGGDVKLVNAAGWWRM